MYTKEQWSNALGVAVEADWYEADIRQDAGEIGLAVMWAYESDKVGQDKSIVEAAIDAAEARYGTEWDIPQFTSVWSNFVQALDDWQAVAEDYFDTEFPGLVEAFGKHMDLEEIGREYARDRQSEQYITIPDGDHVYIFNKLD